MEDIQPFVAVIDEQIVGFADLQSDGLIDMFFVHHAWQRKGVGKVLLAEIHRRAEQMRLTELSSHVSITARPFFEAFGFQVVTPQLVSINRVALSNFFMNKRLPLRETNRDIH